MNIAATLAAFQNATRISGSDSVNQTPSKNQLGPKNMKSDNPHLFSSLQSRSPHQKNYNETQFQVLIEDPDLVIYEPTKKVRSEDHHMNLLGNINGISNHNDRDTELNKRKNTPHKNPNNPMTQHEKPSHEEQASGSYSSESLSTYNSNTSFVELAHKKEIIDLEDDSPVAENAQDGEGQAPEPLVVTDDVIAGLQRERENLTKSLLFQNLLGQMQPDPIFQRPSMDSQRQFAMLAQLMQLNQINQANQRSHLNPAAAGFPFYNMGNMGMGMLAYYNLQNNLLRQNQFPYMQNDFQNMSLLGKRPMNYEELEHSKKQEMFNNQAHYMDSHQQSDVIVLDDEEEVVPKQYKEPKRYMMIERPEEKYRDWEKIFKSKQNVFMVVKRPYWKKPVFKILTQRKKPYPTLAYEYAGKVKVNSAFKSIKIGARERSSLGLSRDYFESSRTPIETDDGRRRSTRLRGVPLLEQKELEREIFNLRNAVHKEAIEDYVIKLHIDENDDESDEIIDTPIGDNFQVGLPAFSISLEYIRPLREVWNPEKIDDEVRVDYFQKIVDKFGKEIVNEEVALRTFKKFDSNVDKIIEELEANKMTFRSFFEIKPRVPKSRVLHLA